MIFRTTVADQHQEYEGDHEGGAESLMGKRRAVFPLQVSFEAIDKILDEQAGELVRAFYDRATASSYSTEADFAGELFTTLGTNSANQFDSEDLIAVHLMGIRFSPTATDALLNPGVSRDEVRKLLSEIPCVDIWSDKAEFDAADKLWDLLAEDQKLVYRGIGGVTAGKLLARKRPQLIPIIDKVVTDLIPRPEGGYRNMYREYLTDVDRNDKVEALRPQGIGEATLHCACWTPLSGCGEARGQPK